MAGILRRKTQEVRREASEEASDVVDCGVFGGEDVVGRSVTFGDDFA